MVTTYSLIINTALSLYFNQELHVSGVMNGQNTQGLIVANNDYSLEKLKEPTSIETVN